MLDCNNKASNGTAAARTCFLGLDLGEVVVIGHQVGHDGLVIRAGNINIWAGGWG